MLVYTSHPFINTGFTLFPQTLPRQDTIHRLCNTGSLKGECGCHWPWIPESDSLQKRQGTGSFGEGSFPSHGDAPASSHILGDHESGCKGTAGLVQPQHLDTARWVNQQSPQAPLPNGSRGAKTSLATIQLRQKKLEIKHNSFPNWKYQSKEPFFNLPLAADTPRHDNASTN